VELPGPLGGSRGRVEPLARALSADAERGADLSPARAVDTQVRDGTADLLLVPQDETARVVALASQLGECTKPGSERLHVGEPSLGTLR